MTDRTTRGAIEAVWRLESTRLVAGLLRIVRDVDLAEDLAQDALLAALAQWPQSGIPDRPGAWLMSVAKRRAVDEFRRHQRRDQTYGAIAHEQPEAIEPDFAAAVDHIEDDVLRLMFLCCHPSLTADAQTTLILKLIGGLSSREIARAFLTSESTIAQRLVRAKRTLTASGAVMDELSGRERLQRIDTVLGVIYLLFNEGYSATSGSSWTRPDLCDEAIRLGRILAALAPKNPEVHGISALMELQSSRLPARTGAAGEPILLLEQDRSRWDFARIRRGLAALERTETMTAESGPYLLQAAIAACHARATTPESTDWATVASLYEKLGKIHGSPVVEVNRAVALGMAYGPQAGLALLDQIADEPALRGYHLLPSVRGDLMERLGRHTCARAEFERAASMTQNERERQLLLARAARNADLIGP